MARRPVDWGVLTHSLISSTSNSLVLQGGICFTVNITVIVKPIKSSLIEKGGQFPAPLSALSKWCLSPFHQT